MKVLLVYPEYPETFWSFKYALKLIAKRASHPPLGLLTVAAMMPPDWELTLVDMNVERLADAQIGRAELVCISAMSVQQASVQAVIARCKAQGKTVMAGGPLFTGAPDDFPEVDYLVLNEAEITFPRFLADFQRGCAERRYATDEHADLSLTPIPRWDLIRPERYAAMSLQLSRGCPNDCDFCNVTALLGRKPRIKSTAQVLAELDRLYTSGWRGSVFVVDDNFIGNKAIVKREILPAMIAWMQARRHPFDFNTEATITLADDDALMDLMARAGFTSVFVGIETPNEASLAECKKRTNMGRDLIASVRTLHRHGLQVQAGFIVGFDNDPPTIFERLIAFIQESGITTAMVGLLNAPCGTRLYERMEREGRLLRDMSGDNADYSSNIVPIMPRESLQQGYQQIIEGVYAPKAYAQRLLRFLRDFRPAGPRPPVRPDLPNLKGLFTSLVVLGILEKERRYFWRLLGWSLFHKPSVMPLVVLLTAYGLHFRKSYERHFAAGV